MSDFKQNVMNAAESLRVNGFALMIVDVSNPVVRAVGNEGEVVVVTVGGAGYCKVVVDDCVFTDMAQPYNVGECARLRRHVGIFENVTLETKV